MISLSNIMIALNKLPKEINYRGYRAVLDWEEDDTSYKFKYVLKNGIIVYEQRWLKDMDLDIFNEDIQYIKEGVEIK